MQPQPLSADLGGLLGTPPHTPVLPTGSAATPGGNEQLHKCCNILQLLLFVEQNDSDGDTLDFLSI